MFFNKKWFEILKTSKLFPKYEILNFKHRALFKNDNFLEFQIFCQIPRQKELDNIVQFVNASHYKKWEMESLIRSSCRELNDLNSKGKNLLRL